MMTRLANHNDLDALALLFDAYRCFYRQQRDLEAAKFFLMERMQQNDAVIFVVEDEAGQLVGFTQLYPLFSSVRMRRIWLLNDLFVLPNQRGKKYSLALMDAAKKHCQQTGAAGILLETDKTNDIGNQLYPRADFELNTNSNFYWWDVIKSVP